MPAAPIATPAYSDNYLPHFDRLHTTDADQRSKKSDADADADAEVEQRNDAFDDIKQPWWRDAGLRRLNLAIAVCFLAAVSLLGQKGSREAMNR